MIVPSVSLPVEFPVLIRVSGEFCLLAAIPAPNSFGNALRSGFRCARNRSYPLAPTASGPREPRRHWQKPIQSPVGLTRSVQ